jgi:GH25 family lysozyme M1 (1,4-beta-N-acetylmuramidase)
MHRRLTLPRALASLTVAVSVATPIVLSSAPNASAGKVVDGPDVSSYQHPNPTRAHPHGQPINWNAVRKSGKEFAIVKATEGSAYVNPDFAGPYFHDYAAAKRAGLVHGAYHFARPATPVVKTAVQQAKLFARVVGQVKSPSTLPPALDLEDTGGLSRPQLVSWAQAFLLKLRALTGRTPMLYTYPSFWVSDLGDPKAFARYPLWMASYGSHAPTSDLWQFTSSAHVKGISGGVDLSRYVGSRGTPWRTLADGTIHTHWPPTAPGPPLSPTATISGTTATVRWIPGDAGTSRVNKYVVRATPGHKSVTVGGGHFAATVSGLKPGTSYSFTVTAVNSVDSGQPSKATNVVTPTVPTTLAGAVKTGVLFGQSLRLRAKLTRADTKKALADRRVIMFRRSNPKASWKKIRKLRTDSRGRASTVITPTHSARVETVFPGGHGVQRSTLFTRYVVHPAVTSTLSAHRVAHTESVTLSGTANPYQAGQKVTRQRLMNGKWVARGTTTIDKHGRYSFTLRPKYAGTYVLRDVVAAAGGRGKGHSPRVHLKVS